ncbi:VOC family protein [Glutamicibacter sp. NPDC087344]|uniref:VOC family protein n=1 Tax=Glutamicibacter sp. NPDC087344 TaxID=3363994 RepID=UPI003818E2C6
MQELGQPGAEPCRVDLLTGDIGRSIEFYGELFGWTTRGVQPDDADPLEMYLGDELVAGFLRNDPQSAYGDTWITYLNVTDAHAASYSAEMYGGYVFLPPVDIEGEGTIAMIGDPTGVGVGLWQSSITRALTTASGRHGTRVWNELHTTGFEKVTHFYRDALEWDLLNLSDTDEFRYQSYGQGRDAKSGIYDISGLPDPHPGWRTYFAVTDTDQTLALAEKLGAKVVQGAQDLRFGRMAVLTDPTGAQFSIIQTIPG